WWEQTKRACKNWIYVFGGSLDPASTNFCKHALFVPTIYKMAINSLKPVPLYYYTQTNSAIRINAINTKGDEQLHIRDLNKKLDIIPETKIANNQMSIFTQNQVNDPG